MAHQQVRINQELPDPFILSQPEGFYLTGTDVTKGDSDKFDLFFSRDLGSWKKLDKILILPDFQGSESGNFWAPKIVQIRNKFCLYYTADAAGDPKKRYVRAAVAERIEGPYHDIGILTEEPSVNGHPFFDTAGRMFLIYTANEGDLQKGQLFMDSFTNPNRLDGKPRRVFSTDSALWEEGVCTFPFKDRIMLFSSLCDGEDSVDRVLVASGKITEMEFSRLVVDGVPYRLIEPSPDKVSPGHVSIFRHLNRDVFICYHAWDKTHSGRYAWIAPMRLENNIPIV